MKVHETPIQGHAWNFRPNDRNHEAVGTLTKFFANSWGPDAEVKISKNRLHWKEAATQNLDCSETNEQLGWKQLLDLQASVE